MILRLALLRPQANTTGFPALLDPSSLSSWIISSRCCNHGFPQSLLHLQPLVWRPCDLYVSLHSRLRPFPLERFMQSDSVVTVSSLRWITMYGLPQALTPLQRYLSLGPLLRGDATSRETMVHTKLFHKNVAKDESMTYGDR